MNFVIHLIMIFESYKSQRLIKYRKKISEYHNASAILFEKL